MHHEINYDNNMTTRSKKMESLMTRFRKIRRQREKTARLEELAAKREKERLKKEEKKFRLRLKKSLNKSRQLAYRHTAKISILEKKLDRILKKNKLKT